MRFTVLIFLIVIVSVIGGGFVLLNADIAPSKQTVEIELPVGSDLSQ